ncbi:MAG: winged helix-turn-helix transcriptional regulator [Proteobacteria bacterium]|nr:winged helix-turn-helix transcriptional regulator [Pseudomonadota bacterium]
MIDLDLKFLAPHRMLREYQVLCLIDDDSAVSQHRLAEAVGLSSAMVNNYIKAFVSRGLVEAEGNNNRSFRYYLTPQGRELKQSRMSGYLAEVARLYAMAHNQVARRLKALYRQGLRRAVLFADPALACIVNDSAADEQPDIVGVIVRDGLESAPNAPWPRFTKAAELDGIDFDGIIACHKSDFEGVRRFLGNGSGPEGALRVEALFD